MNTDDSATHTIMNWPQIVNWSIGTVGPVAILYLVSSGFMIYMTDVVGLSGLIAGALIAGVRVYDMFVDPLMGRLSDRTRSRMGRRRPWMLAGAIVMTLGSIALFSVPATRTGQSTTPQIIWTLAALLIYFTGYSMFNVPYMAMPAEMTDGYHDRTRLMSARVIFVSLSSLIGAATAPRLIQAFGGGAAAYQLTAGAIGMLGLLAMLYCVSATKFAKATAASAATQPLLMQIRIIASNRPFVMLVMSKLMLLLSMSSLTSSLWYMVQHVLHRDLNTASNISAAQTAGMLLCLPLWLQIAKARSKSRLFVLASIGSTAVLLSWMLVTPLAAMFSLVLRGFLLGAFAGGALLMGQSMLPDTMEFDFRRTGERREGTYSGFYSVVEKAGFAIGPPIIGFMLSAAGYVGLAHGEGPVQLSAAAVRAVYWGVSIIPALATIAAMLPMRFYTLTEASLKSTDRGS